MPSDPNMRVELKTLQRHRIAQADTPWQLDCGRSLAPIDIAYESWGTLNADKSNAILVCHALTGDQFAGSDNPVTQRPAWWSRLIGPDKPLDTNRFFVLASNVLGGCMGSTGPGSENPNTEAKTLWLTDFPVITIGDMVRAQKNLLDALEIPDLFAVIGGSMGGMQVLQWASQYPEQVFAAIPIATAARQSAQNIGLYEVGRQAIMADPDWHGGDYTTHETYPGRGLAVARMAAHITYMSEQALKSRFDRSFREGDTPKFGFDADFQVESYLRHQGRVFGNRFDANSYLYLTRAMDYFDLAEDHEGHLAQAFSGSRTRFCVFSFSSDWHYPPAESRAIVQALHAAGAETSYLDIDTKYGHDSFFLESVEFESALSGFLDSAALARGIPPLKKTSAAKGNTP